MALGSGSWQDLTHQVVRRLSSTNEYDSNQEAEFEGEITSNFIFQKGFTLFSEQLGDIECITN